jgi:hypothetical protein
MKIRKRMVWLIALLLFILLSNVFLPVRWLVAIILPKEEAKSIEGIWLYTTRHGEFQRGQNGLLVLGNSYSRVLEGFNNYKRCHPNSPDTVLYRTYRLKIWQFWDWINYFTEPRWKHPYLDTIEINNRLNPTPYCTCPDYRQGPVFFGPG